MVVIINKNLYHLSEKDNLTVLTPRIPECAVSLYENVHTKRICFSDTIEGCLSALQDPPKRYYVYTPKDPSNISDNDIYFPTVDDVRDVKYTHELWILKEICVKCIGIIESKQFTQIENHNTGRGRVTFFHYPYEWIEKWG